MADPGQALEVVETTHDGRRHSLRYQANPHYSQVDFTAQISYGEAGVTPAYLRQAARELCGALTALAVDLEMVRGPGNGGGCGL